jgi:hypothetical protein
MKALEFYEVPKFLDLVASFKESYSSFRRNNPTITGKNLRMVFLEILERLYNKFSSFEDFKNIYPTFEDFKSKISRSLHKKNGFSSPSLKKVNLNRDLEKESIFESEQDQKIEAFNQRIDQGAWKNFIENQRMLKLTGHEDDW